MHSTRRGGGSRGKGRSRNSRGGIGSGARAGARRGRSRTGAGNGGSAMPAAAAFPRPPGRSGHEAPLKGDYAAGFAAAALHRSGAELAGREARLRMNEHWTQRFMNGGRGQRSGNPMKRGRAFADGFAAGLHRPGGNWVPVALTRTASAVVVAGPGAGTEALLQLLRLPLEEIVVVLDGAGEADFTRIRALPDITIVHSPVRIGPDVGLAVGARMAASDLVLFADAYVPVAAEQLAAMLAEAQAGSELVLADVSGQLGAFRNWDDPARIRAFMNWSLGRPDLSANSAAVLPHVWSRPAMERIGLRLLAVPPMAHRAALEQRLRIRCSPVASAKPAGWKTGGGTAPEAPERLSAGDHIEALRAAMREKGARLALPDEVRRRSAAGGGVP